jgi:hypothetical protein
MEHDSTFTNQRLVEGDSGCGLFVDGKLSGVFSGIAKDGTNRRLFANVDEIRRFIDGESKAKPAPKSRRQSGIPQAGTRIIANAGIHGPTAAMPLEVLRGTRVQSVAASFGIKEL